MAIASQLKSALVEVGTAVRRPEQLAKRWQEQTDDAPPAAVFGVLLLNAVVGVAAYGLTMQMHRGPEGMVSGAFYTPLAAGLAWCIAFPALYIIRRILGSKINFTSTALAASITVSFGASALLASVPINWFFTLALPWSSVRWLVNVVVFSGVGFCMADVFLRVMRELEPRKSHFFAYLWLALLGVIGAELFYLFGIFNF
ncbi:hypothetical protein FIV42_17190 [Persicimonas caeni]|jgi:hypothetical protein|uniref:Yip1 domain-containing protein n=1 Tax=Persicimonas caeni TaxID=2292766 RepID=A0A4Y6PVY9_PERCE|nr:hypothetical protein [Persicimonas caeni]QDG52413.1 hypothetical protein FIV42_17190 [Persicimonas caeni]QED33635.1 hypothetical protein FRD00_17185 [Persicimonas caeni]